VDFRSVGIDYHVAGDARWMNGHAPAKKQTRTSSPLVATR